MFFVKVSMYFTLHSVPPVSCFITVALVALTIPSSEPEHNEFFFLLKICIWQTYVVSLERPVVAQKDKQKSKLGVSCDETDELKGKNFRLNLLEN